MTPPPSLATPSHAYPYPAACVSVSMSVSVPVSPFARCRRHPGGGGCPCVQAQSRRKVEHDKGRSAAPRVGLVRALTAEDVSAPPELRAALLQVSQGVEHLHSLRIVHRCV